MTNFHTVARDITWSLVFTKSPFPMAIVSKGGNFTEVNNEFCRLLGYNSSELHDRTFQSLTHPDDLDADLDMVRRCIAGEVDSYEMVKRYISKLGEIIYVRITVKSVVEYNNLVCFFVVAAPVKMDLLAKDVHQERLNGFQNFFGKNWTTLIPWVVALIVPIWMWFVKIHDMDQSVEVLTREVARLAEQLNK